MHKIDIGGKKRPVNFGIGTLRKLNSLTPSNPLNMFFDAVYLGLIQADKANELPAKFDTDMLEGWIDELDEKEAKVLFDAFTNAMESPLFRAMKPKAK